MMKKIFYTAGILLASSFIALGWGTWGHQHINRAAIFALPTEMRTFFYNHADFITEEALVPDIRKHNPSDRAEMARHYIDLEDYKYTDAAHMPQTMKDAAAKYNKDSMQQWGILPWHIQEMMKKLTTAMKEGHKTDILYFAADLGHYIGDSHMPLHTSSNHDGQLSDQRGIHAFWETQLPEMFGDNYNLNVADAHYFKDVTAETWRIMAATHLLADTMLRIERSLKAGYPKDKIYEQDAAGKLKKNRFGAPVHSKEYAAAYHTALHGMVESQMRLAINALASYWYTAWVDAGKPDLTHLDPEMLTARNKKNLRKDYRQWQKGTVAGFKAENEF